MVNEEGEQIQFTHLARRRHTSVRGTAWCGTNHSGHFIPKGVHYETFVQIVEGEFESWNLCDDCDADLRGYEGAPKHRHHSRPEKSTTTNLDAAIGAVEAIMDESNEEVRVNGWTAAMMVEAIFEACHVDPMADADG